MVEIKGFKPRLYQETILNTATQKNTLIVLPTGMGKTKTAILIAVNRLRSFPKSKILFLTPTKPLADQICNEFRESIDIDENKIVLFTGAVPPKKRAILWKDAMVIVSTPQGCSNDIINNNIDLKNVSLLAIDECHRATGDYDYCFLAKQYNKKARYPRIIGLTASPGSDLEKITEICKNLAIEEIEIRTELDEDVKPYVQELQVEYVHVELPEDFKDIKKFLDDCLNSKLKKIREYGYIRSTNSVSKKALLELQKDLQRKIVMGDKDYSIWRAISSVAEAIKVEHAIMLLETQGISALYKYMLGVFEAARKTKVKATKNLAQDLNFKSAYVKVEKLVEDEINHPKHTKLKEIVKDELKKNPSAKIIIFNQFRDSATKLVEDLNKLKKTSCVLFVGQMKKHGTGMSQKEQIKTLNEFRDSIYNILVSTSIGEEGLDIPKVDIVIFYEPVPSAIRTIQRMGRTARLHEGKVIVLVTKNTRDEAYRWTAHHKEKKMHRILKNFKEKIKLKNEQKKLESFIKEDTPYIIADSREKDSGIVKELSEQGINITMKPLHVGDYILSDRVCVELKTKEDFVDSIVDKRLLHQAKALKTHFERPIIILQGIEDIYSVRRVHPNAIRGMLAMLAVSYNIPVIHTQNIKDTAALLLTIAKREQESEKKEIGIRTEKKPLTTKELQEYIVESLPGIGPSIAKSLLKKFKSVREIINADEKELQNIDKIGEKTAKEIKRILEEIYKE